MVSNPIVLADLLDDLRNRPPSTAALSMAEEATIEWRDVSPELRKAHRAFSVARFAHKDAMCGRTDRPVDEAWEAAIAAAGRLAAALRALGPPLRTVERWP